MNMTLMEWLIAGYPKSLGQAEIDLLSFMQRRCAQLSYDCWGASSRGLALGKPGETGKTLSFGSSPASMPTSAPTHIQVPVDKAPADPLSSYPTFAVPLAPEVTGATPLGSPTPISSVMKPMPQPMAVPTHNFMANGQTHTNIFGQ